MPSGGARNRSGPQADPSSLKSAKRGISLTALPAEGHKGRAPKFPLPSATDRELELWTWAWKTPQAAAWAQESWRWYTVAMWVRTSVVCEGSEALAADKNSLHRFADQVGMTPAGLKENGWRIAADQVATKRAEKEAPAVPARPLARDRFKVVGGGA